MSLLPIFRYDEFFTDPVRLLVKESHAIFANIPRDNVELNKSNAIAISRRYRSIVHECVENLTRDIQNDHSDQIKTFKEIEVVWHLCEILLLDVNQTGTLIMQLRHWTEIHFNEFSPEAKEMLKSLEEGYRYTEDGDEDTYWSLLTKLVLRGETKRAIQLLSCHHDFHLNNQMQTVVSMLDSMPLSNQYMLHEFCRKWDTWSAWCKRERATGQFDSNPSLLNIVRLLSQDHSVYETFASSCETWYQLMVSYLFYSDPCIRLEEGNGFSELCRRMISIFKKNNSKYAHLRPEPSSFDEIIISTFKYDLVSVIADSCAYFDDNWWFVTHFVDLLHCSNQLMEITESDRLRETFLQDYASTLFDDELLWPIGVSYIDSCSKLGSFFLELLLSRINLDINDEVKAHKIISIAKRRGLATITKSICLLMARGWLSRTPRLGPETSRQGDKHKRQSSNKLTNPINLANAFYWAVKSGDTPIITYISDQYLLYYCKTGTFPDVSVFESLRRTPLENERLAFLAKYFEFRQLMDSGDGDLSEAGSLMKALLASKVYPRFFCPILLDDLKKLLEVRPQLIFQPDKTLDLMRSVEEITKGSIIEEDIDLRKNLVRNMARALITPIIEK